MDIRFCRFLVLLCVFTGSIKCYNPLQILEDETRKLKHHTVKENINYLVPDDGEKWTYITPPNRHVTKFETRRSLHKLSGSSSLDNRRRKRLRSGSFFSNKISDVESNQIAVSDRVRLDAAVYGGALGNPLTVEATLTETNRKHDEFMKQITGDREDNRENVRVKSVFSPTVTLNQFYVDLPIYKTHNPSETLDRQNEVVYRYQINEESKDSSQSSDEKRNDEIRANHSATDDSRKKTGTKRMSRKRTSRRQYRSSSNENADSSKSGKSENDSSSAEDYSETSEESRKEGAATTLKTHVFTLTTQSVDITAPPTIITSSFGKVTTSYSTRKRGRRTVKAEITKEILHHRGTSPEMPSVTSSALVTRISDFPTTRPDSGKRLLTELEFTTKALFVTKSPQTETRKGTTTATTVPSTSRASAKDPVTIGPVKDFIRKQGSIPITIVGVISASIIAVAMIATSSFIGSRSSQLERRRSPSLASLPDNIELQDV